MLFRLIRLFVPGFYPLRIAWLRIPFLNLVALLRPKIVKTKHGFDLDVPKSDKSIYMYWLWLHGIYEAVESQLMIDCLKPGDTVVDVGANIGFFTCLLAREVGKDGAVYAFEPNPQNFSVATNNVRRNDFQWARVYNQALSDSIGSATLYLSSDNQGDHTLVPVDARTTLEIETTTFDAFVETLNIEQISLVKIDVQGWELSVLNGMRRSLEHGRIDHIVVEFTPFRICQTGNSPVDFIDYLLSLDGYTTRIVGGTMDKDYADLTEIREDLSVISNSEYAWFNFHVFLEQGRII